nr:copia protein [Tanacetum cinerariifolium]
MLVEVARTMLIFSHTPLFLWAEVIATAYYTQNRSIIHYRFNKTPYELINGKKPDIFFLHVFRALCYPKNDREDIGKLGAKGDIGFFIGYSADSCTYRVYNRRTKKIIETMNVTFDELSAMAFEQSSLKPGLQSMTLGQINSGLDLTYAPPTITTQQPIEDTAPTPRNSSSQATNIPNTSQDIDGLKTQKQHAQQQGNQARLQTETIVDNVLNAMFDDNTFVNPFATPFTSAAESSSSQYVDPSNMDREPSQPVLTRNQLRSDGGMCMYVLTVSTMELNNIKEAMTDPAWIESMQEELLQFKRLDALYGLKQAPRAWYNELSTFLLHNHFFKGTIDPTLFIRCFNDDILVVHVYVDEIIFGSTHPRPDIVHAICLCARYQAKPTEKKLKEVKRIFCYLRRTVNTSLWYTKDFGFELTGFLDTDYVGCKDTFKSTSSGAQFLGENMVSWSSKKQDCTMLSTAKAEYVSLSACFAQVLWMRTRLTDYDFHFNKIPIYYDSKSAISISCNLAQHSRTKHITVRYHFIKEHVKNGTIGLYFVKTDYQLADLFTKALLVDRFNYLVRRLGMRNLSSQELDRLAKSQ